MRTLESPSQMFNKTNPFDDERWFTDSLIYLKKDYKKLSHLARDLYKMIDDDTIVQFEVDDLESFLEKWWNKKEEGE